MCFVYIVQCKDLSFYIGWTTDVERRVFEHNNSKKGAKYTKTRRPVNLVYYEEFEDKISAMKREYALKKLTRKKKEILIGNSSNCLLIEK